MSVFSPFFLYSSFPPHTLPLIKKGSTGLKVVKGELTSLLILGCYSFSVTRDVGSPGTLTPLQYCYYYLADALFS